MGQLPLAGCRGRADAVRARRCGAVGDRVGASTAKEHHLVPKHWLRAFAEDGHVLGRRRGGAEHRTPVRRAAVARHLNTDPLAEGERRVALETYLDRHVDGPCAPVLRALREGQWPLEEAQHALRGGRAGLAGRAHPGVQVLRRTGRPPSVPGPVGAGGSGPLRGTAGTAAVEPGVPLCLVKPLAWGVTWSFARRRS
ncbi:DUF4238 domain-containing protein [Streptomyces sp. NPDC050388]|uniref:DUF4238 domain-containing protein n=1 Tax=Streptomyces sp. NPDC050388 TaxID=3155781 RepID=UPI0034467BA4